jgi:hypothetical protein
VAPDEAVYAEVIGAAGSCSPRRSKPPARSTPDVHVIPEFVPGDLYATVQARTEGADLLVLGAGDGECTSVRQASPEESPPTRTSAQ